jgi:ABC-type amino acid transport substrate-binding protein
MKFLYALPILASLAMLTPAQAKDWKTVTITLEGAYAPWNLTNPDGSLGGFEPALAKVLCARMKVQCTLVASPWDGMIAALNAGRFDVIMDALAITEERKQTIAFSIPYAASPAAFVTATDSGVANIAGTGTTITMSEGQKDVAEIKTLRAALAGKTIGIMAATAYATFIYDNFGDVATIREYKTGPERDLDLQTGRIDAIWPSPARRLPGRSGARAGHSVCARRTPSCRRCSARRSSRRWRTAPSGHCRCNISRPTSPRRRRNKAGEGAAKERTAAAPCSPKARPCRATRRRA